MNLKRRFSMLPAACLAGLLFVGCTTETTETHYVKLSEVACTFLGEGGPKVITVEANPGYEVSSSASWLKVGDEGESSFSLTADANDSGSERVAEVTVTAGEASVVISVNQLPSDSEMAHYRLLNKFNYGAVVSPNGRYAGGSYQTLNNDNTYNYHVVIIDLETEEWHEVGEFQSSLYKPTIPSCITDDGTLFFAEYNTYGNLVSTLSGDNYLLEKAYPDWIGEANVEATTADGTVWVGYQQWMNGDDAMEAGYDGGHYMPIKWTNGEPEILPLPEKNYRNEPWPYGRSVMARGVSYDGCGSSGSAWDNTNQGMVYWKDGEVHWAGEDIREFEEVTLLRQEDGKEVPFLGYDCICRAYQLLPDRQMAVRGVCGRYGYRRDARRDYLQVSRLLQYRDGEDLHFRRIQRKCPFGDRRRHRLHREQRRCFGLCGRYRERNAARNHGAVDIRQLRHYGSCRLYTASVPQRDGTRVLRDECRGRKSLRRMVRPADGDVMPGVGE